MKKFVLVLNILLSGFVFAQDFDFSQKDLSSVLIENNNGKTLYGKFYVYDDNIKKDVYSYTFLIDGYDKENFVIDTNNLLKEFDNYNEVELNNIIITIEYNVMINSRGTYSINNYIGSKEIGILPLLKGYTIKLGNDNPNIGKLEKSILLYKTFINRYDKILIEWEKF